MVRQQRQAELRGAGTAVSSRDPRPTAAADCAFFCSVSASSASRVSTPANLCASPLPCSSLSASSSRTVVAVTAVPSVTAGAAAAAAPACAQPVAAVPRGGSASSTLRSARGAAATSRGLSSVSSHPPSSAAASSRLSICHRGASAAAVPASCLSLASAAASRSPSASAGAAALKLHHAQLSLLQTRDPYPLPRLPAAILDDETYSKTVSRIITRDYYPDLPMLRLLQQLFDAENRQDSMRAAQLLHRINMLTPASVRNGRHFSFSGASVVEAADPREALAAAAAARARKRSRSRCPDSAPAVAAATQTATAAAGICTALPADSASVVASTPALPARQGAAALAQEQQQQSGPAVAGVEETAAVAAKPVGTIAGAASAREVPPTAASNTSAGSFAASSFSAAAAAAARYISTAAAADDNPSLAAAAAAACGVETVAPVKIEHGGPEEEDEREEAAGRSLVSREYLVISSDESSSPSEDQTPGPSAANAGDRGREGRCKKRKAPGGYSEAAEPVSSDEAEAAAARGAKGGTGGGARASGPAGAHEEDERAGRSCNPRRTQREGGRKRVLSWRDRHRRRQQRQRQQQRVAPETDGQQRLREKGLQGQQQWQEEVKEELQQHPRRRGRCCTPEDDNQESTGVQQQLVDGLLGHRDSQESRGTLGEDAGAAGRRRGGDMGSSDSRGAGAGAARGAAAAAPERREGKVAEETRRRRGAPDEDEEAGWGEPRRGVGDAASTVTCITRTWGARDGSTAGGDLVGSTTETAGEPPLLTRLDNGMLHRVRTGLRLDAFLKRYSSEGTRSFWCLMKEERQQQRQHCWRQLAAQAQEQHNCRMVEIQKKTVRGESSTELAVGFINTQTNLFQKNAEVVPPHKQPHELSRRSGQICNENTRYGHRERHEQHLMTKLAAAQEQERVAAAAARKTVDMRPWGGGAGARAAAAPQGVPAAAAAFQATLVRGDEQETEKGGREGTAAAAAENGSALAYAEDAPVLQSLVPTTWAELLTTPALVAANSPCCTPVLGSSIYEPCPLNTFSSAAGRAAAAFDLSTFHLPAVRPSERALERLQQQAAARMQQQQNRRMEHVLGAQTSAALLASGTRYTSKSAVAAAQAAALLISKSRSVTSVYSSHRKLC